MKCPNCGAENDAANRFCDQCGARLDQGTVAAAPAAAVVAASASTCPVCSAPVLPGQAFCEECGTALNAAPVVETAPAAAVAPDAPTVVAPAVAADTSSAPAADEMVACPACGHHNLPGDAYCENCGASLTQPAPEAAIAPSAVTAEVPLSTAEAPAMEMTAPPVLAPDNGTGEAQLHGVPSEQPPSSAAEATSAPEAAPAPEIDPANMAAVDVTAVDTTPTVTAAAADTSADHTRLQDELTRQGQIIAQLEQMQTMFGANVPPAVVQGLAEAHAAQAKAEAELQALAPAAPAVDPAEVARLQEELAHQGQIIVQFEQMQTMFGANVPPAVAQGLAEAHAAQAKAEAELESLTGTTATSVAAPAVAAPAVAATPEPAPTPEPTPALRGARLVVESSGAEIALPLDKSELILGREDPISGIFPEVDLTPHGGESGGVSRQHAKLVNTNGQWALVDLNSTNYTRIDGTKLDPNTPSPVHDGARIQLGRVAMVFHQ